MYQTVIIVGNLGTDAELKEVSDVSVVNFSVAANEKWKDKNGKKLEHTEWFNCELWGDRASAVAKYLTKGKLVAVEGTLRTTKYEKDGDTKYFTRLRVNALKLLGGGTKNEEEEDPFPPLPPKNTAKKGR